MTRRTINIWESIDWWVVAIYLLLVIAGWVNIYAASYDFDNASIFDFSERSGKQLTWIACSAFIILVVVLLDTRIYEDFAYPFYILMMLLLVLTIFVAPDIKGSRSWLVLGPIGSIQPAEFAKFSTALMLAKLISESPTRLSNWKTLLYCLAVILLPMMLIILQSETGTALIYLAFMLMFYREGMPGFILLSGIAAIVLFILGICFGDLAIFSGGESAGVFYSELFVGLLILLLLVFYFEDWLTTKITLSIFAGCLLIGYLVSFFYPIPVIYRLAAAIVLVMGYTIFLAFYRQNKRYLLVATLIAASFVFSYSVEYIFDNVLMPHQRIRIEVALGMQDDPRGVGYNVNQSKIAIGSGGFLGKGFLNGTQTKLKYVPEQDTDFIFCTIGEEWGFLGATAIITLFAALLFRLVLLAERQRSTFSRVYGYCLVSIIALHLCINIGMTIGITPVIGIPLPFFSYGGSSLWAVTILLFVFLRLDAARLERF